MTKSVCKTKAFKARKKFITNFCKIVPDEMVEKKKKPRKEMKKIRFYFSRANINKKVYLTYSEIRVALLIYDHKFLPYSDIAKKVSLSKRTIETYAVGLFKKIGVCNRRQAVDWLNRKTEVLLRMRILMAMEIDDYSKLHVEYI